MGLYELFSCSAGFLWSKDLEKFLAIKLKNVQVIYDPVINDEMFKLAKEPIVHKVVC